MVVLKVIGKILLLPVWSVVAMTWLLVKVIVAVYSFVRSFVAIGLGALIIGTVICYQDWKQVILLLCISGISISFLLIGTLIEEGLDFMKKRVGRIIMT